MEKLRDLKYMLALAVAFLLVGCIPRVIIDFPLHSAHFAYCEEITFSGSATDLQDGQLAGNSLVWTSDIDGEIGKGSTVTRDDLSSGTHQITLTATNSKGQTGRTTTTIIVDEPAVVEVTDDINADTTWGACRVYVIKAWDFWINAALEIEAGVIVKFDPDLGPGMNVAGTVVANGTEENPVIFTSYKDDATGGDTNEDGGATGPGPGDWNNIYVQSDGSIFDYCRFYYGGAGSDSTLEVYDSGATVTNCTFAHNMGGDYATLDASHALSNTLIVGNAFYDNERPLLLNTTFGIDDSNVFHNPDDSSEKNVYNGIFLDYPDAPILSHIAWGETEVPFVINHNDLWIEEDASLALADNVIVKFMPESELIHYGNIFNHDAPGVYFTSYNDDEHGGDTNGDGASTSASEGDWVGIYNNSADAYETWPNILYDEIH